MFGKILAALMLIGPLALSAGKPKPAGSFAIYYGNEASAKDFKSFDLVVLESEFTAPVKELKKDGKTTLGYLSVGEVNATRDYFIDLKRKGLILEENPNWPDAYFIDIRKPEWEKLILERLIPEILESGFDGVFLDTIDSSIEKERVDPKAFAGMNEAALKIVRAMRKRFPEMKIMLNRGYGIAKEAAPSVDYVLGESILGTYDFQAKRYMLCAEESYRYEVGLLKEIRKANPKMQVMTLDYCAENDAKRRAEIRKREKENGFVPYVTTIGLDAITRQED